MTQFQMSSLICPSKKSKYHAQVHLRFRNSVSLGFSRLLVTQQPAPQRSYYNGTKSCSFVSILRSGPAIRCTEHLAFESNKVFATNFQTQRQPRALRDSSSILCYLIVVSANTRNHLKGSCCYYYCDSDLNTSYCQKRFFCKF